MCFSLPSKPAEILLYILILFCFAINIFTVKILLFKVKQHFGFRYQLLAMFSNILKTIFYVGWALIGFNILSFECLLSDVSSSLQSASSIFITINNTFDTFQFISFLIITYDRIIAMKKPFLYDTIKHRRLIFKLIPLGLICSFLINCFRFIGNIFPPIQMINSTATVDYDIASFNQRNLANILSILKIPVMIGLLIIFAILFITLISEYRKFIRKYRSTRELIEIRKRETLLTAMTIFSSAVIFCVNLLGLGVQVALVSLNQTTTFFPVMYVLRMSTGYLDIFLDVTIWLGYLVISSEFRAALKKSLRCGNGTTQVSPSAMIELKQSAPPTRGTRE